MSVTPEDLAAFADGELEAARREAVAAAIAANPALAAQVEAHRALRSRLAGHFAPILDEPPPERLTRMIAPSAGVVDLAAARADRDGRRRLPRWSLIAAPALAASLALAIFMPGGGSEAYAPEQLAGVLDSQLAATQPDDAPTRILLSFRDRTGAYCRAFSGTSQSEIACRDARGWKLRRIGAGAPPDASEYRQAGSADATILAAAQAMAAGVALDAAQEGEAQARGWR